MFLDIVREELVEIVENEQWTGLLPYLFQKVSCPVSLQAQTTDLFRANLELLQGLRDSPKTIVVSPALNHVRGMIDYVVDDVIVELKTAESVMATQVCQVALYTYAARAYGVYDPCTAKTFPLPNATPALHFARFGAIAKVPMPSVSEEDAFPEILVQPVSRLCQNPAWLNCVFNMGEVQALCADLEAYLTSRGVLVPAITMSPAEMSILGMLVDTLVKTILARNFSRTFPMIRDELVRIDIQLRRL